MYIKYFIDYNENGLFFPQNNEFFSTVQIVRTVRNHNNKKTIYTGMFNKIIMILIRIRFFRKIFGNFYYDINNNNCELDLVSFQESLEQSIKGNSLYE